MWALKHIGKHFTPAVNNGGILTFVLAINAKSVVPSFPLPLPGCCDRREQNNHFLLLRSPFFLLLFGAS